MTRSNNARWLTVQGGGRLSFTIATYNLLAQCLVKRTLFPYAGKSDLRKNARYDRVARELLGAVQPDIACLQEVDGLGEFYAALFQRAGYDHVFMPRTPSDGNGVKTRVKGHGLCILFKRHRFRLCDSHNVRFDDRDDGLFGGGEDAQPHQQLRVPNIGQMVALELLEESGGPVELENTPSSGWTDVQNQFSALAVESPTGQNPEAPAPTPTGVGIIVTNHHLYWNPAGMFERLRQSGRMLSAAQTFRRSLAAQFPDLRPEWPLVVAGDFNATPTDATYRVLTGAPLSERLRDLSRPSRTYGSSVVSEERDAALLDSLVKSFGGFERLQSAYAEYMDLDPEHEVNPNWYAPEMLWPDWHQRELEPGEDISACPGELEARAAVPSVTRTVADLVRNSPQLLQWRGEPSFTAYTQWKGTLDYIFTEDGGPLRVGALLRLPRLSRLAPALPNGNYGSDHVLLCARLHFVI